MSPSKLFRKVHNSSYIFLLSLTLSVASLFQKTYVDYVQKYYSVPEFVINTLAVILFFLVSVVLITVLAIAYTRVTKKKIFIADFMSQPDVSLSPDCSPERIKDFRAIRAEAKESIFVMGIGMTFFSQDSTFLTNLLDNNISVKLLMIDPDIIVDKVGAANTAEIAVLDKHFDKYFSRVNYCKDINSSFERLRSFIEQRAKLPRKRGKIELRKYPYFIPINFTIADEDTKPKMLVEVALPLSDNRYRVKFIAPEHQEMCDILINDFNTLWDKSFLVIKD